ncbi:MAG: hypothetical protein NTY54_02990 [Actinobacteria bacterium]|nr:hypothetical protein [Actinomycetota bacterium]
MIIAISNLFGLPAHPFLVHIPIVLIPLATITAVASINKKFRAQMLLLTAAMSVVGLAFLSLAAGAGESLQHDLPRSQAIREHAESGEKSQGPTAVFAFAAVGAVLAGEATKRKFVYKGKSLPKWSATALLLLTVVGGIASTVAVSQAGHSGAKSVWDSRPSKKKP